MISIDICDSTFISFFNKNYLKIIGSLIDIELLPYKDLNIRSILLHNALTDLVVGLNFPDVIKYFVNHISTKYKVYPGFCTLSSYRLMIYLYYIDLSEQIIMAPFNPIGFQMNPNKNLCENAWIPEEEFVYYRVNKGVKPSIN